MTALFWIFHCGRSTESQELVRLRQVKAVFENKKECREEKGKDRKICLERSERFSQVPMASFPVICLFSVLKVFDLLCCGNNTNFIIICSKD